MRRLQEAWLLIADFAEIDGRIECVGMQLRSYICHQESVVAGETEWGTRDRDALVTYDAYWTGGPVADPAPPTTKQQTGNSPGSNFPDDPDAMISWPSKRKLKTTERCSLHHPCAPDSARPPTGRQLGELRGEVARRVRWPVRP